MFSRPTGRGGENRAFIFKRAVFAPRRVFLFVFLPRFRIQARDARGVRGVARRGARDAHRLVRARLRVRNSELQRLDQRLSFLGALDQRARRRRRRRAGGVERRHQARVAVALDARDALSLRRAPIKRRRVAFRGGRARDHVRANRRGAPRRVRGGGHRRDAGGDARLGARAQTTELRRVRLRQRALGSELAAERRHLRRSARGERAYARRVRGQTLGGGQRGGKGVFSSRLRRGVRNQTSWRGRRDV